MKFMKFCCEKKRKKEENSWIGFPWFFCSFKWIHETEQIHQREYKYRIWHENEKKIQEFRLILLKNIYLLWKDSLFAFTKKKKLILWHILRPEILYTTKVMSITLRLHRRQFYDALKINVYFYWDEVATNIAKCWK